jgi:signal peptidase II
LTFGFTAVAALAIEQLGSYLVTSRLPEYHTHVVTSVIYLTHLRNTGGVFSLLPGHGAVFVVISSITILGFCLYVAKSTTMALYQSICFGLIVGAAAGNVCDRLVYGAVIDFIDIQGIPHWHYIFNIADFTIHLGAWPLVIGSLVRGRAAHPAV